MIHSREGTFDREAVVELVDPVLDEDQWRVLFALKSRQPHWSTESIVSWDPEEQEEADDEEFERR